MGKFKRQEIHSFESTTVITVEISFPNSLYTCPFSSHPSQEIKLPYVLLVPSPPVSPYLQLVMFTKQVPGAAVPTWKPLDARKLSAYLR